MNNIQKVSVELKNGKFRPIGISHIDDLNPKALILCSAAQCAGFTVMGLLSKENITLKKIEITVVGTLNTPTLRAESLYEDFDITYNVECNHLSDQNSVANIIRNAHEKYCGVVAMLRKIAPVSHQISIVSID